MRTQVEEHFGGGVVLDASPGQTLRAPLPYGIGGARLIHVRLNAAGVAVNLILPETTWLKAGGRKQYVVSTSGVGGGLVAIKDSAGTTLATILGSSGESARCYLVADDTLNGTWMIDKRTSGAALGSSIPTDREIFDLKLTSWDQDGFDLRSFLLETQRYQGLKPAAIRVRIGGSIVIGSETTSQASFSTGVFPPASTLLLIIDAGSAIVAKGGAGGRGGGGGLLSQNGSSGGDALKIEMNTWLLNNGSIEGGGGGGGGGASTSGIGGGGGGGGAGYTAALGGAGGTPGGNPGGVGAIGLGGPGGSGGTPGGYGGSPGVAGSQPTVGGLGGAAGRAIVRVSAYTLTKIRAGTILGSEVAI